MKRVLWAVILVGCLLAVRWPVDAIVGAAPTTAPAVRARSTGEQIPSEDPLVKNLHSMGLIDGHTNVFRSACPVSDITRMMTTTQPSDDVLAAARARMQHLYDLGIRTDISFQTAGPNTAPTTAPTRRFSEARDIDLERKAAEMVGIKFINDAMSNSGPDSLQSMSDDEVHAWLDAESAKILDCAKTGGVLFHCQAGHDRAGIVGAYIRIKFEHWPVDQAIDEMRRLGHD
jgi:hypothetical protein